MLKDIIPARFRKAVYAAYALAAVVIGALVIAGVNTGKAPDVLAYLGIAVGAVAAQNTGLSDNKGEDGAVDTSLLVVLILLGVVLLLFGVRFNG